MTAAPSAPWPRPVLVWQHDRLFREPDYPDGWALEDEAADEEG